MAASKYEIELLQMLEMHEILHLRGYAFSLGPNGGVIADRWGHMRGLWSHVDGVFGWTPASHTEPVHWSEDAAAAVRYTLVNLSIQ